MENQEGFKRYILDIFNISSLSFKEISIIFILVFVGTIFEILSIGLIIPFVSILFDKEINFGFLSFLFNSKSLVFIILLIFGLLVARSLTIVLISFFQARYSQMVIVNLRVKIMKSFFLNDYSEKKKKKVSEFVYSVNDLSSRFGTIFLNLIKTISDLIFAIAIFILLGNVDIIFLFFFIFSFIIWLFIYDKIFGKLLKKYGEKFNLYIKKVISSATESFNGFKEILILNSQSLFEKKLENDSKVLADYQVKHFVIFLLQIQFLEILVGGLILGSIVYLFILGLEPALIIAKLGIFAVGIFRLKPIAATLNKAISDYRFNRDVLKILKQDLKEIRKNKLEINNPTYSINKINNLSIENLFFEYDNKSIFENINLKISKGDIIGIKGKSGVGKTTFLDLICGFQIPNKGNYIINDKKYNYIPNFLKNKIGYIPQDSFIIDNDIKTNVAVEFKYSKISIENVTDALIKAGLEEFKYKLDMMVGENGKLLSEGQKQRLIIARQFYRDNQILILDESTNALDEQNEMFILKQLKRLKNKPIIIIVSHNIDLKNYCNKIYEIKDKKINLLN